MGKSRIYRRHESESKAVCLLHAIIFLCTCDEINSGYVGLNNHKLLENNKFI